SAAARGEPPVPSRALRCRAGAVSPSPRTCLHSPGTEPALTTARGSRSPGPHKLRSSSRATTVSLGSGGCRGHRSRPREEPVTTKPSVVKEKSPVHFLTGQRQQSVSTPRAEPPALEGLVTTRELTRLPRRDGPAGSVALPGAPA
ncbi:hypothetical protein H1C71_028776, partial [Ictidomys tridecemlineatus]